MMSTDHLPPDWLAYKTEDGKAYYYNVQTKVTTWTLPSPSKTQTLHASHPAESKASVNPTLTSASSLPVAPAGRGGLLAQIQKGTKLKKSATRESSPLDIVAQGNATSLSSGAKVVGGVATPPGGDLMSSIRQGQNQLRKKSVGSSKPENNLSLVSSTSLPVRGGEGAQAHVGVSASATANGGGGGGFAEIMRKNREAAAAKKANGLPSNASTLPSSLSSASAATSSPPKGSTMPSGQQAQSHKFSSSSSTLRDDSTLSSTSHEKNSVASLSDLEIRLHAIEAKLDKILTHFKIT